VTPVKIGKIQLPEQFALVVLHVMRGDTHHVIVLPITIEYVRIVLLVNISLPTPILEIALVVPAGILLKGPEIQDVNNVLLDSGKIHGAEQSATHVLNVVRGNTHFLVAVPITIEYVRIVLLVNISLTTAILEVAQFVPPVPLRINWQTRVLRRVLHVTPVNIVQIRKLPVLYVPPVPLRIHWQTRVLRRVLHVTPVNIVQIRKLSVLYVPPVPLRIHWQTRVLRRVLHVTPVNMVQIRKLSVLYVLLVRLQTLGQVMAQPRVLLAPRVCIHCLRTLPRVRRVLLVRLQILEQVLAQPRVLLVPLVRIRCLRTLPRVRLVLLVRLQTLEQILAQARVLLVTLVCIRCLRTLPRVRLVPTANIKTQLEK